MSGSDWKSYLNGETSAFNFLYTDKKIPHSQIPSNTPILHSVSNTKHNNNKSHNNKKNIKNATIKNKNTKKNNKRNRVQ